MGSVEDTFNREGFVNWVVGIDLYEVLCNGNLDAIMEPLEEGGVVLIDGNVTVCKEGYGDSQEVPVVF